MEASLCQDCGESLSQHGERYSCLLQLGIEGGLAMGEHADGDSEEVLHLGDYEVFEEIGRGGMGAVDRARQVSLNREVASGRDASRPVRMETVP